MKLKQWLKEYKQMSYSDYTALPDIERWTIEGEFRYFNTRQNKAKQTRENFIKSGGISRPATEAEIARAKIEGEKERVRYETNLKIGGIDERGNYTALSHRWENPRK